MKAMVTIEVELVTKNSEVKGIKSDKDMAEWFTDCLKSHYFEDVQSDLDWKVLNSRADILKEQTNSIS